MLQDGVKSIHAACKVLCIGLFLCFSMPCKNTFANILVQRAADLLFFSIVVACFNLQRHYPELTCELPAVRQQFISSDAAYMSSQDGQEPTLLDQDMC